MDPEDLEVATAPSPFHPHSLPLRSAIATARSSAPCVALSVSGTPGVTTTYRGHVTATRENGFGIRNPSHVRSTHARSGLTSNAPIHPAPVSAASCAAPGLATIAGPFGPSAVIAQMRPSPYARSIPRSPTLPPREDDPRTATNPSRSTVRAINSPSKLRLIRIAIPSPRNRCAHSSSDRCQKTKIVGG